jgi:hypothetical protein
MSTPTLEKTDREFFDEVRELFCNDCGYGIVVAPQAARLPHVSRE